MSESYEQIGMHKEQGGSASSSPTKWSISKHWYKSYSGGRWTWPTPLKLELKLHEVPTTDSSQVRRVQVQVHRGEAEVYLNLDEAYLS